MIIEDLFKDRGLNSLIPLFAAIYLSFYDKNLRILCLFLAACVIVFYLIVMVIAKDITNQKPKTERDVYRGVVTKDKMKISGIISVSSWIIGGITLVLLYGFLNDFVAYTLFWLLIVSYLFNFLRMFVVHSDIIKLGFKGQL